MFRAQLGSFVDAWVGVLNQLDAVCDTVPVVISTQIILARVQTSPIFDAVCEAIAI